MPLTCSSQVTPSESKQYIQPILVSNIDRYGVDYILKDYIFTSNDSTFLNQLDLSIVESQRSMNEDVEVVDPATGLTIILFFEKKGVSKH